MNIQMNTCNYLQISMNTAHQTLTEYNSQFYQVLKNNLGEDALSNNLSGKKRKIPFVIETNINSVKRPRCN